MSFQLYKGDGTPIAQRGETLPPYSPYTRLDAPSGYVASPELRDAVNVALALGQPLLLTGEPGTGKTQLAFSIAHELGLDKPNVFYTKTNSSASDLFYRYDSLAHFRDIQVKAKPNAEISEYITFEALGKAIIESANSGRRTVVLIDEVDKAPRDLPNDLLHELENMAFRVRETGQEYKTDLANRPIVVLTSNSEKNLPDAFLRRCVYFHIPFPNKDTLAQIVNRRLSLSASFTQQMLSDAIAHFTYIRENKGLRKPPATAELLAWIHILDREKIDVNSQIPEQIQKLAMSYSILAKTKEDLGKMNA